MLKRLVFIFTLFMIFSCGKNADEKTASAVLSANIYLSKGNCQAAINVLEDNGRQNNDAHYLKVLASAYACRAGFAATTFIASDLALTGSPAPLGGTTLYSTSLLSTTSPLQNDTRFSDLQTAIQILLYAGGIPSTVEPTASERLKYFSSDEAGEINSQLLFMMFAQLGKYMHVYGNGDAALGKKGAGSGANKCFTGYTDAGIVSASVLAVIAALPVTCRRPAESSHAELATAIVASTRKSRLCHGVVLLNGLLNILPSVVGSATGTLGTQASAFSVAANAASAALKLADPAIGIVASTINQTSCEDNSNVPVAKLESYFALMYESIFLP
ncbi:MAG: hypothetical protein Q7U04_02740 [Bacteriovorax sp.]|nr:hypothetical protein [Bacteriovorax sp.]